MNHTPTILPNVYSLGFRSGEILYKILHEEIPSTHEIVESITTFPVWYKEWWINLLYNDPVHVFVETTLIATILYFLVTRRSKNKQSLDKLTKLEEEELLEDWKNNLRKPLCPESTPSLPKIEENNVLNEKFDIVVHKTNGRFMELEINHQPRTVLNFCTFDFLGMQADTLDEQEHEQEQDKSSSSPPPLKSLSGKTTTPLLHPVKQASLDALDRYGCGSCGPRGFYGTVDVHLELERLIAEFCQTDDAILYSDGASTVTSTVAAFCKRGDLLVVDEGVYEPIRTGVQLSRANVKYFAHNDMEDLRRILTQVRDADVKLGRPLNAQRRFLVVEGLYKNTGNICKFDELVKLKHEFHYRLIVDESFSFGTLGETGRGITDLYHKRLMHDAEIVTVSLENALGSIGALTIGTEQVVDHQRLSGSGYCFSASSPPFTASAASAALKLLQTRPDLTLHRLQKNQKYLFESLQNQLNNKLQDLLWITSDERSPIILLQVAETPATEYLDETVFLQEVVRESLLQGIAFVSTTSANNTDPPPGIRITVSSLHTVPDMDKAVSVLGLAVETVMSRFHEEEQ